MEKPAGPISARNAVCCDRQARQERKASTTTEVMEKRGKISEREGENENGAAKKKLGAGCKAKKQQQPKAFYVRCVVEEREVHTTRAVAASNESTCRLRSSQQSNRRKRSSQAKGTQRYSPSPNWGVKRNMQVRYPRSPMHHADNGSSSACDENRRPLAWPPHDGSARCCYVFLGTV